MDFYVFIAVLAAAAFHAGWNALLKLNTEPVAAASLVAFASSLIAAPFVLWLGMPAVTSWPYLAASVVIHILYYVALAEAYRGGDLGQIYPIARGSAPLLTATLATAWLGETLGPYGWAGVIVLAVGIVLLAFKGGRSLHEIDRRSVGYALLTSLTITAYTLVDGSGARLSGSPLQYTVWLFLLSGALMGLHGWWRLGPRLVSEFAANWTMAFAGAGLSTAAYAIAIWAMTVAPIALVAALRETGVLFATLFGTWLLREPLLPIRIAAACLVAAGIFLARLR